MTDTPIKPITTLCGFPYTAEAHRTWDQTLSDARCPQCEGLVALRAKGDTPIAEGSAKSAPNHTQSPNPTSRLALDAFLAERGGVH